MRWTPTITGACAGMDTELFYGSPSKQPQHGPIPWEAGAIKICNTCRNDVWIACLKAELKRGRPHQYGVRARMTAFQRRDLFRRAQQEDKDIVDIATELVGAGGTTQRGKGE